MTIHDYNDEEGEIAAPGPMQAPVVSFIDVPTAPDVFASDAVGFFVQGGTVPITFTSNKVDHSQSPGPINRVVIGRLVMPIEGAQGLAVGLFDFLTQRGLAPKITPKNSN